MGPRGRVDRTLRGLLELQGRLQQLHAHGPACCALQKDGKLRAEIVAHSRWLTCMDIHPTKVCGGVGMQPARHMHSILAGQSPWQPAICIRCHDDRWPH